MAPAAADLAGDLKLVLLLVVAIATVLVWPALSRSLWLDEVSPLNIAQSSRFWAAMRRYDHPPLYVLLLRGWALLSERERWLRLPGLLMTAGAALATAVWARRRSPRSHRSPCRRRGAGVPALRRGAAQALPAGRGRRCRDRHRRTGPAASGDEGAA